MSSAYKATDHLYAIKRGGENHGIASIAHGSTLKFLLGKKGEINVYFGPSVRGGEEV